MNCPKCKAPLPDDAGFCPECGSRTQPAGEHAKPDSYSDARFATAAAGPDLGGLPTITPIPEHHTDVLEEGSIFAERYEIVRKLGAGAMGVVYLAKDPHDPDPVALKLIHPDLVQGEQTVQRLRDEGVMARRIRHPNVVAIHDVADYQGQPYFTMEYVPGGSLRTWMSNRFATGQDVPLETAAGLMKSMLGGIAEAHRMGFVHRDLKPENILLAGNPDEGNFDLKILDFGIAKAVKAPGTAGGSGRPVGTMPYMAPEQMTAGDSVGPSADIYSLTVIFYEMLMEFAPQGRPEPVSQTRPEIPKAVDALIGKGMAGPRKSRYQTAADFEKALDAAIEPERPEPPPPHSTATARSAATRSTATRSAAARSAATRSTAARSTAARSTAARSTAARSTAASASATPAWILGEPFSEGEEGRATRAWVQRSSCFISSAASRLLRNPILTVMAYSEPPTHVPLCRDR